MDRLDYVRLFADEEGESHFEDGSLEIEAAEDAPPMPRLGRAWLGDAVDVAFIHGTKDWAGNVHHPSPYRQLMCVLEGRFEVEASDGSVRRLVPGSVLLLEDTRGRGHATRVLTGEALIVAVRLAG